MKLANDANMIKDDVFIEQPSVVDCTFKWEKEKKALSERIEASSFLLVMKKWSEHLKLFF